MQKGRVCPSHWYSGGLVIRTSIHPGARDVMIQKRHCVERSTIRRPATLRQAAGQSSQIRHLACVCHHHFCWSPTRWQEVFPQSRRESSHKVIGEHIPRSASRRTFLPSNATSATRGLGRPAAAPVGSAARLESSSAAPHPLCSVPAPG